MTNIQIRLYDFIGLSSDTKPTAGTHLFVGGNFYETDTGDVYIWDGNSWLLKPSKNHNQVVDPDTLEWVNQQQGDGGSSGGDVNVTNWPATQPVSNVSDDPTAKYKISDVDDAGDPAYFGYEAADGSWYIMKNAVASKTYRYAAGGSGYSAAWTNRASQSYGYLSDAL